MAAQPQSQLFAQYLVVKVKVWALVCRVSGGLPRHRVLRVSSNSIETRMVGVGNRGGTTKQVDPLHRTVPFVRPVAVEPLAPP